MQFHLELRIQKNIAAGMDLEEARCAALRDFGGIDRLKEQAREQRGGVWVEQLLQDIRYGARVLLKSPLFAIIAVLSLALGIGAATSVFSLVDAVLLGSLPVPNPQDLRVICWTGSDTRMMYITLTGDPIIPGRKAGSSFSKEAFFALRKECSSQADIFGYSPFFGAVARARGLPVKADGVVVSGNFFSGLGVHPLIGNLLGPDDETTGSSPRIAISYRWWKQQFALNPGAIGQQITLNGNSYTISGVLPENFSGVCPGDVPDLYVSLSDKSLPIAGLPKDLPAFWWLAVMGRMRPGVSNSQLQAAADVTLATQADKFITKPTAYVVDGRDGPFWKGQAYQKLQLLLAVVGIVLLVACLNIGRPVGGARFRAHHELSMRKALGASGPRIVGQLLTESALISILGGGLGMLLSVWGRIAVSRLLAGSPTGLHYDATLDGKVLLFATTVTFLTVILAGLFPALKGAKLNLQTGLWQRGMGGPQPLRAGQFLVAAQIALSLVLITGAGLYFRTLANLVRVEPGFAVDHLLSFDVDPEDSGYQTQQVDTYYDKLQRALSAIPGIKSIGLVSGPLLGGSEMQAGFSIPDRSSIWNQLGLHSFDCK